MDANGPLGLPGQVKGLPTIPLDKGDDTQERFRYQWAMGVTLIANGFVKEPIVALWCEYYEDFLIELPGDTFVAVQVKSIEKENAVWRLGDDRLDASIARFCQLEELHGARIRRYEFCSNAKAYVPAASVQRDASAAKSPTRLIEACKGVEDADALSGASKDAFAKLLELIGCAPQVLLSVLQKLHFRQGPSLRDFDAVLASEVIPAMPGCADLTPIASRRLRESLMGLVQTACRVPTEGIDGVLAYLASNGQPQVAIRGKCITLQSASEVIEALRKPDFQFVDCGLGLNLQGSPGRTGTLQKKMRNAYIGGQFEPLRWRMESAEHRLLERAIADAETFETLAQQLTGSVLMVCKDAEAGAHSIDDDRQKGPYIYAKVLDGLKDLATKSATEVYSEPVDTLMGVAGMLSGECRFAWGVPLEGEDNGP